MSRFEISLPGGRDFTGVSAGGVTFRDGKALIVTAPGDGKALSALSYFRSAGYNIQPLDGESVEDALREQGAEGRTATDEAAALKREIADLRAARDLEELRKERDALYREVHGHDRAEDVEQGVTVDEPAKLQTGSAGDVKAPNEPQAGEGAKLAPPQNDAPVAEWREWAVASGRATEDEVSSMPRADIIRTHGRAYDAERAAELEGGSAA